MRKSINQCEMEENSDIHYNTVITKEVKPNGICQTQKHKHMASMKQLQQLSAEAKRRDVKAG